MRDKYFVQFKSRLEEIQDMDVPEGGFVRSKNAICAPKSWFGPEFQLDGFRGRRFAFSSRLSGGHLKDPELVMMFELVDEPCADKKTQGAHVGLHRNRRYATYRRQFHERVESILTSREESTAISPSREESTAMCAPKSWFGPRFQIHGEQGDYALSYVLSQFISDREIAFRLVADGVCSNSDLQAVRVFLHRGPLDRSICRAAVEAGRASSYDERTRTCVCKSGFSGEGCGSSLKDPVWDLSSLPSNCQSFDSVKQRQITQFKVFFGNLVKNSKIPQTKGELVISNALCLHDEFFTTESFSLDGQDGSFKISQLLEAEIPLPAGVRLYFKSGQNDCSEAACDVHSYHIALYRPSGSDDICYVGGEVVTGCAACGREASGNETCITHEKVKKMCDSQIKNNRAVRYDEVAKRCVCTSEFSGIFCNETPSEQSRAPSSSSTPTSSPALWIVLVIVLFLFVVVFAIRKILDRLRDSRRRSGKAVVE